MHLGDAAVLAVLVALPFLLTIAWRRLRPTKPHKRLGAWAGAFVCAGAGAHRAVTAPGAPCGARVAAGLAYGALALSATAAWPPLFFFTGRARSSARAATLAAFADLAALAATAGAALLTFQAAVPDGSASALLLPLLAGLAFAGALANGAAAVEAAADAKVAAAVEEEEEGEEATAAAWPGEAAATAEEVLVARAHLLGGLRPGSASLAAAAVRQRKRRRRRTEEEAYCDPGAAGFRVRGGTYLEDGTKIAPPTTRGRLAAVELVRLARPRPHIARFLPAISASPAPAPFTFVWQVSVPGRSGTLSLTAAWSLDYHPVARVEAAVRAALDGRAAAAAAAAAAGEGGRPEPGPPAGGAAAAAAGPPPVPTTDDGGGPWWSRRRSRGGEAGGPGGGGGGGGDATDAARAAAAAGAAAAAAASASVHRSAVSATGESGRVGFGADEAAAAAPLGHRRAATAVNGDALAAAAAAVTPTTPPPPVAAPPPEAPASTPWWEAHIPGLPPGTVDPFDLALARFIAGCRNPADPGAGRAAGFKIIPRLTSGGGWVLQRAVGQNTPCLLATKIDTKYYAGPSWFEVDVDVGSSRAAAHVVALVQGAVRGLVIDIAVLIQGNEAGEELPEGLIGVVRLDRLDLACVHALPE